MQVAGPRRQGRNGWGMQDGQAAQEVEELADQAVAAQRRRRSLRGARHLELVRSGPRRPTAVASPRDVVSTTCSSQQVNAVVRWAMERTGKRLRIGKVCAGYV